MSARRWYAHITLVLGNIPDNLITLAKLALVTPYRWITSDSSGQIQVTAVTASRAVATDANGLPTASATTATELGYVSGVTSAIQTQLNAKLANTATANRFIVSDGSGNVGVASAVTAGKLVVSDGSGLPTANSNTMTGGRALQSNSSNGHPESSSVTSTELGYVSGVTSAIQTQMNTKLANTGTARRLVIADGSGNRGDHSALTASRALATDSNGTPVAATTTSTELDYVNGVTSAIQTQINTKLANTGTARRLVIADGSGNRGDHSAITASRAMVSDSNGTPTHATLTSANLENVAHTVSDTTSIDLTLSSGTLSADVKTSGVSLTMLAGGTGSWVYVSTQTASGSATINFTGLTTYDAYKVVMYNVSSANDAVNFLWRASTDNGSTYDTAANYGWSAWAVDGAGTGVGAGSTGDTSVRLAGSMGNADTTEAGSGIFYLIHRGSGSTVSRVMVDFAYRNSTPTYITFRGSGSYNVGNDVDAIRFLMSAGNIATGTFRLYGMRES